MVGLFHDFILVEQDEYHQLGYSGFFHDERRILISDDLIRYMFDTLSWIPSKNPSNEKTWKGHGLNLYGPTLITLEGGRVAAHLFRHWVGLFQQAPSRFQLHSGFDSVSDIDGNAEENHVPHVIHVDREQCIKQLQTIVDWAQQVSLDERLLLLHNGV